MSRRTFTTEFKRQAVLLVLNEGIPAQTVAIKLENHANTLYRWIREYEKHGERAFPGNGSHEYVRQNQIKRFEKEHEKLKKKLELLKKFDAFLRANQK